MLFPPQPIIHFLTLFPLQPVQKLPAISKSAIMYAQVQLNGAADGYSIGGFIDFIDLNSNTYKDTLGPDTLGPIKSNKNNTQHPLRITKASNTPPICFLSLLKSDGRLEENLAGLAGPGGLRTLRRYHPHQMTGCKSSAGCRLGIVN